MFDRVGAGAVLGWVGTLASPIAGMSSQPLKQIPSRCNIAPGIEERSICGRNECIKRVYMKSTFE